MQYCNENLCLNLSINSCAISGLGSNGSQYCNWSNMIGERPHSQRPSTLLSDWPVEIWAKGMRVN